MTEMSKSDRQRAIAVAREGIQHMDETCREVEVDLGMTQHEQDRGQVLSHLIEVKENDPDWKAHADAVGEWDTELFQRAWLKGLLPDGERRMPETPLIGALQEHISRAKRDLHVYEALCGLAAGFISDGQRMPYELRIFVCDVLRKDTNPPSKSGRPKNLSLRDRLYYFVIEDISMSFGIRPTRNRASKHRNSACDIVAEAMPREGNRPDTYESLVRIWMKGKKEEDAGD